MDKVVKLKIDCSLESETFNLKETSEIRQLKLLIAGRFKLYDISTIGLIFNGNVLENISDDDKIKNVFKIEQKSPNKTSGKDFYQTINLQVLILDIPKYEFNVTYQYYKKNHYY